MNTQPQQKIAVKLGIEWTLFLFSSMAARVIPAHNPFMSWKPLANVSQKSFRHLLLISEITFAPVKGVVLALLLKDYLISGHIYMPRGNTRHVTSVIPDSPFGINAKTKLSFTFKTFTSLIFILKTSVLDTLKVLLLLVYGAPYGFRGSPGVLLGWAIVFSLHVCCDSTPGWSSCRVHQI